MVSLQLKPKQSEKYNGKRDFQIIDNRITSVDSYFALTHAEAPDIYRYLKTILTGEAATWFQFLYRNVDPNAVTWEAVKTSIRATIADCGTNRPIFGKQPPSPTTMLG